MLLKYMPLLLFAVAVLFLIFPLLTGEYHTYLLFIPVALMNIIGGLWFKKKLIQGQNKD